MEGIARDAMTSPPAVVWWVWLLLGIGIGVSISIYPRWRRHFWGTRHGRTLVAALIALALGGSGLAFLELHPPEGVSSAPSQWHNFWHYFGHHVFAVLASVGTVGLLIEVVIQRALFDDFKSRMRGLLHFDAEFAEMLSVTARQELVQSMLVAQLPRHGDAIYDGVVARYLKDPPFLRTSFDYEAILKGMDQDRVVETGLTLKQADYFELTVSLRFKRMFSPKQSTVGCTLDEHGEELQKLFADPNCIFREVLYLTENDRKSLTQLFAGSPATSPPQLASGQFSDLWVRITKSLKRVFVGPPGTSPPQVSSEQFRRVFDLEVRIDDQPVVVGAPELHSDGQSILLPLVLPELPKQDVLHEIVVRTVIAKNHRQYPVHLAEPTLDPRIVFDYTHAVEIHGAAAEAFFNSKTPFGRNIQREVQPGRRRITLRGNSHEQPGEPGADRVKPWVFPNSGALFTWRVTQATGAGGEPPARPV